MPGLLLDTHVLYWLVSGEEQLTNEALVAIGEAQEAKALLVSPITAWELAVATSKARVAGRPHLGDNPPARWFRDAVAATEARIVPVQQRISIAAADVVTRTGHRDPGDCFLIATALVRKVPMLTRDAIIRGIAIEHPNYLEVMAC